MTIEPDLVEKTLIFVRRLKEKAGTKEGQPIDKEFIDSLYERDDLSADSDERPMSVPEG